MHRDRPSRPQAPPVAPITVVSRGQDGAFGRFGLEAGRRSPGRLVTRDARLAAQSPGLPEPITLGAQNAETLCCTGW